MASQGSVTLKLVIYLVNIALAIFDKVSHILYYFGQTIYASYIKGMILFFLLASPTVQIISWAIILGQISLGEKFSDNIRVKNAKTQIQYYKLIVIEGFQFILRLAVNILKSIPLSIGITILQEIKMFPFALFGYSYFKYKAIITTTIMNNIAPLIEEKRKQMLEKKEKQMNPSQNLERIQQTRRRGLNQINNFQDAVILNERNAVQNSKNTQTFLNSPAQSLDNSVDHKQQLRQSLLNNNGGSKLSRFAQKQSTKMSKDGMGDSQDITVQLQNQNDLHMIKNISQDLSKENFDYELQKKNLIRDNIRLPMNIINRDCQDEVQENEGDNNKEDQDSNSFEDDEDDNQEGDLESQESNSVYNNKINRQISNQKKGFARVVQIIQQKNADATGKNSQFMFQNGSKTNMNKFKIQTENQNQIQAKANHSLDLLLEANCKPTIEMLVFDKNLTRFLQITNVIQTFFEALPLSNLWYDKEGNYNIIAIFSFLSSCIMIFQFGIQLIQLLYGKNISVFYQTMQYLNNPETKQDQCGSSSYNLGSLFQMPTTINIVKINQLEKINNLSQNALDKITNMTISLPDHAVYFDSILTQTKYLVNKVKNLEQLYLNFKQITQQKHHF